MPRENASTVLVKNGDADKSHNEFYNLLLQRMMYDEGGTLPSAYPGAKVNSDNDLT